MKRVIMLAAMIACFASVSLAQDKARPEFFAGFSVNSIDTGLRTATGGAFADSDRETGFGFETSATGYFNKQLGIEGNVDGHFKTKDFSFITCAGLGCPPPTVRAKIQTYNFMVGPHVRLSNDVESKVTPFVHALLGANHSRVSSDTVGADVNDSETDFALKLGGGVDFSVSPRVGVRLSADYNPIFQPEDSSFNTNINGGRRTRNDAVFSVGVVFK
ncbi:MAG: outer membrane beta-barrel protein [Pyrinomonadaceae bacterium]